MRINVLLHAVAVSLKPVFEKVTPAPVSHVKVQLEIGTIIHIYLQVYLDKLSTIGIFGE